MSNCGEDKLGKLFCRVGTKVGLCDWVSWGHLCKGDNIMLTVGSPAHPRLDIINNYHAKTGAVSQY